MKNACYILSFYFMALAGLACTDSIPEDNPEKNISIVSINDGGSDNHNHHSNWDDCSPLCVCHCCHIHFLSTERVDFTHFTKSPAVYTSYFPNLRSVEIPGFLKPPRS